MLTILGGGGGGVGGGGVNKVYYRNVKVANRAFAHGVTEVVLVIKAMKWQPCRLVFQANPAVLCKR